MNTGNLKEHLNLLKIKDIKGLIRQYNLHYKIKLSQKKPELITDLLKHFEENIIDDNITSKKYDINVPKIEEPKSKAPRKPRIKKDKKEVVKKVVKEVVKEAAKEVVNENKIKVIPQKIELNEYDKSKTLSLIDDMMKSFLRITEAPNEDGDEGYTMSTVVERKKRKLAPLIKDNLILHVRDMYIIKKLENDIRHKIDKIFSLSTPDNLILNNLGHSSLYRSLTEITDELENNIFTYGNKIKWADTIEKLTYLYDNEIDDMKKKQDETNKRAEEKDFDAISKKLQQLIIVTPIKDIQKALLKLNFKGRMQTNKILLNMQVLQNFNSIEKMKKLINSLNIKNN